MTRPNTLPATDQEMPAEPRWACEEVAGLSKTPRWLSWVGPTVIGVVAAGLATALFLAAAWSRNPLGIYRTGSSADLWDLGMIGAACFVLVFLIAFLGAVVVSHASGQMPEERRWGAGLSPHYPTPGSDYPTRGEVVANLSPKASLVEGPGLGEATPGLSAR